MNNTMTSEDGPVALARDVWKSYDAGKVQVLRGVNLRVSRGDMVALWGPSGSGKSTLLHLLGGLDLPDKGTLSVCGLNPTKESDRLVLRRSCLGFVFQLHNLIPDLSVAENIRLPGMATGLPAGEANRRMHELAEKMGISHRLAHRIQDLSGGERQRTAICRALFGSPKLLLADEPTGSLDEKTGDSVFGLLKQMAKEEHVAVILATHERRFAEACDRMIRVKDGELEVESAA